MLYFMRAVIAVTIAALSGCGPVDMLNATVPMDGVQVWRDVAYAPGPRLAMDVYAPRERTQALPMVVFFYGGSWQTGARWDYRFAAASLAKRGMVVVVPDYRLYPEVQFPAFVEDAAKAVAAARARAGEWGGDPKRLVLMGHSAGAHIAALLALDPRYLAAAGDSRDHVAGFVGMAGPYDFLPITGAKIKLVFAPANNDLSQTQPVNFADAAAPPSLLLHGLQDLTVLPRNSEALATRLERAGAAVTLKEYGSLAHIGIITALTSLFAGRAPVLEDVVGFVMAVGPR